jgi:hypothetical protein
MAPEHRATVALVLPRLYRHLKASASKPRKDGVSHAENQACLRGLRARIASCFLALAAAVALNYELGRRSRALVDYVVWVVELLICPEYATAKSACALVQPRLQHGKQHQADQPDNGVRIVEGDVTVPREQQRDREPSDHLSDAIDI